ncbi:MAG: outer membrane receptor protein involved in Fe transport, partial [Pseudohongiellaceae bacterium]
STIVTDPAVTDPAVTGSPPDFKEYTANAAKGNNYGIEAEADWRVTDSLRVFSSLGWLETKISSFKNPDPDAYNLEGREQAHAPRYQYSLGTQYDFMNNFYVSLALEGKANFYFSDSHGQKSKNYNLVNATIGYDVDQFSVSVWAKNLTDEDYTVRGFGFDNDPRTGNEPEQHIQLAEPRVVGVSARYNF